MYSAEYHDREKISEKEAAVRERFNTRAEFASNWWRTNKAKEIEDYKQIMKMYDAQNKYGNPYSFFLTLVGADLSINLKGGTVSPVTPPGGGGNSGAGDDDDEVTM